MEARLRDYCRRPDAAANDRQRPMSWRSCLEVITAFQPVVAIGALPTGADTNPFDSRL